MVGENIQLKDEGIFLKLKGVSKKGSISLGPNLGYPSLIVFAVIPMVNVVCCCGGHTTCSRLLFCFG